MLTALRDRCKHTVCAPGVIAGCVVLLLVAGVHESLARSCAEEVSALAKRLGGFIDIPGLFPKKNTQPRTGEDPFKDFLGSLETMAGEYFKMLGPMVWLSITEELLPDLIKKGQHAYDAGEYATALEQWQCALDVQRKVPEQLKSMGGGAGDAEQFQREVIAALHGKIGRVYAQLAQYPQALDHFQQAQAISHAVGDQQGEGESRTNMGEVYRHLGRYPEALEQFQQALHQYRGNRDPHGEGKSRTHIGEVYLRLSRYPEALEQFQQALSLYQAIKERAGEGDVLGHLGTVYMGLGQYPHAQKQFQQALRSHRDLGRRREEGEALRHLATVYQALADYPRALDAYQQALAIHRLLNDMQGQSRALTHIGDVHTKRKEYPVAQTYYDQALALTRITSDRYGEGTNLSHLGWVAAKLEHDEDALRRLEDALDILQTLEASESLWQTQRRLGFVQAKRQQHEASVAAYTHAITTLEAVRTGVGEASHKISFWQDKVEVYDELLTLLSQLSDQQPHTSYAHQAFAVFERKQARVFLEQIGESSARRFRDLPEGVIDEETRLLQAMADLHTHLGTERAKPQRNLALIQGWEAQLGTLKAELQHFDQRLQREFPDYYALKHPQPVTLDDVRTHVLRPHELLLMYNVMADQTLLWLIQPQALRLFRLPVGEQTLQEKVNAWRKGMQEAGQLRGVGRADEPSQAVFAQTSSELYNLLIPPEVRSLLTDPHLVYIVPTGPLYGLPFEALVTKLTQDAQGGHYLLEDVPIAYVPSASLLKTLRDAAQRSPAEARYPLLAFAHPVYDAKPVQVTATDNPLISRSQTYHRLWGGHFQELPETEDEARAIAALLNAPPESEPLQLREAALRATVLRFNTSQRLQDYRYLLFATHGVLAGEITHVTQPALVLSYPHNNEGYLTMEDVFSLRLNAKLVTLSACNTGGGEQARGEGVMGLTRAFMYAGTPAVAVTLWSVESLSAKNLSVGLFRFLRDMPNPAQALRASKLCLLRGAQGRQYHHPYYWAPFVVFGDAGPWKAAALPGEHLVCH